jgi:preprotein translocase subunit SecA
MMVELDQLWKDHLHNLDHLRQGISLRAYGQKDPLNEYKKEAFHLFTALLSNWGDLVVNKLCFILEYPEVAYIILNFVVYQIDEGRSMLEKVIAILKVSFNQNI